MKHKRRQAICEEGVDGHRQTTQELDASSVSWPRDGCELITSVGVASSNLRLGRRVGQQVDDL